MEVKPRIASNKNFVKGKSMGVEVKPQIASDEEEQVGDSGEMRRTHIAEEDTYTHNNRKKASASTCGLNWEFSRMPCTEQEEEDAYKRKN